MEDQKRKAEAKGMVLEEELKRLKDQNLPDLEKLNSKMIKLEGQLKRISNLKGMQDEEEPKEKKKKSHMKSRKASRSATQRNTERSKIKVTARAKK